MFEDIPNSFLRDYAPSLEDKRLDSWFGSRPQNQTRFSTHSNPKSESFKRDSHTARQRNDHTFVGPHPKAGSRSRSSSSYKELYQEKILENKLKGITDNSERYRIVDDHLKARDSLSNPKTKRGSGFQNQVDDKFSDDRLEKNQIHIQGPVKPSNLERIKNSRVGKLYQDFVKKQSEYLPDMAADRVTAMFHGVQLKDTPLGKIGKLFGASEVNGVNPITGEKMNIDYLSNLSEKNLEKWKNMHREETSKSARKLGDNIDPFNRRGFSPKDFDDNYNQRNSDRVQLQTVEKRITDSKNNIKQFFNPVDKEELSMLEATRGELQARMTRHEGKYPSKLISQEKIEVPKSVSESFSDLHKRRTELMGKIQAKSGSSRIWDERSSQLLKQQLHVVDQELARNTGHFSGFKIGQDTNSMAKPNHTKTSYKPVYGTTGYGLGFMNSMKASRTEHLARAGHYMNPFGAGGASSIQAIKESFGFMNSAQRMQANQARGFSKVLHNATPIASLGVVLSGMADNKDGNEIFEDLFGMGTAMHGWRTGSALGAAMTKEMSFGRLLSTGVGGLTGLATGFIVGSAVAGGISDATSNDSSIRKFAKKSATKEATVHTPDTRQSLTARQASLQKLARSGLNDRGLLIGNEAALLTGAL